MSLAVATQEDFAAPDFLRTLPERPELTQCVTLDRPLHTAKIAGGNRALCRAVCIDLLAGRPRSAICADYRVGWETVGAIEAVMRERGELRGLHQTLSESLSACIVLMLFRLREALIDGTFSAAQIPIAVGVLMDKKSALDAGIVPAGRTVEEVGRDRLKAWAEAARLATELASAQRDGGAAAYDVAEVVDTAEVTAAPVPLLAGGDGAGTTTTAAGGQAGGGIAGAADPGMTDGLGREKFEAKEASDGSASGNS